MKPQKSSKIDYEKVKIGELVTGTIEKIEYDDKHKFTYKGEEKTGAAVRFVFLLDGYSYRHYSPWMSFNYGEKANLYNIYLSELVDGATPDMDFDLDYLVRMKVKTLWKEKDGFQKPVSVFPLEGRVKPDMPPPVKDEIIPSEPPDVEPEEEDLPY